MLTENQSSESVESSGLPPGLPLEFSTESSGDSSDELPGLQLFSTPLFQELVPFFHVNGDRNNPDVRLREKNNPDLFARALSYTELCPACGMSFHPIRRRGKGDSRISGTAKAGELFFSPTCETPQSCSKKKIASKLKLSLFALLGVSPKVSWSAADVEAVFRVVLQGVPGVDSHWAELCRLLEKPEYAKGFSAVESEAQTEEDRLWWAKYHIYLQSDAWKERTAKVRARCHSVCESCGSAAVAQVHHLTYARVFYEPLEDLQGVCLPCHAKYHPNRLALQLALKGVIR